MEKAKAISEDNLSQVSLAVNFYSNKGDLIGTLLWAILDFRGNIKHTYLDKLLPTQTRCLDNIQSNSFPSKNIIRCFKNGIKKCSKDIKISSKTVFVAIPLRQAYQDLYKNSIKPALEELQLKIWTADEKISNIDVMCKICQGIQKSSFVLTIITDWNANVLFQIGLAYGLGKNVILIKDRTERAPFEIKSLYHVEYENADELKRNILTFFKNMEKQTKI